MSEIDPQSARSEIFIPTEVNLDDLFWIEPSSLGSVNDMINSAHLSTMALGVESRREELAGIRTKVMTALLDPEDPLFKEQERAIDVGVMYGALLTKPASDQAPVALQVDMSDELPSGFLEKVVQAKAGLDPTTNNGAHNLFMRLRDLEVEFAGSDVLAFCLASTQDHMGGQFMANHKGQETLASHEMTQLKTLFYAGTLAGALAATDQDLPREEVQIMRGWRNDLEPVGIRLEFEPGENLEDAVSYQMSSKYIFTPTMDDDGKKLVAVMPGGLQFGPNAISVPIFVPGLSEPPATSFVDVDRIDAFVVRDRVDEQTNTRRISLIKDVDGFLGQDDTAEDRPDIIGLVVNNNLISAYNSKHPSAVDIDELVGQEMQIKSGELTHADIVASGQLPEPGRLVRIFKKWSVPIIALSPWATDALIKTINSHHEIEYGPNAIVSAGVLVVGGLAKAAHLIRKRGDKAVHEFDLALQNHLDNKTLRGPKNLGTLSASNEESQ